MLEYVRWVMVRKRDESAAAPGDLVPQLPKTVDPATLGARVPDDQHGRLRLRARRQPASLRRLSGRREDRPRRRHDGGGSRAPDGDAALSEHRARALQPVRHEQGPLRPPADLRRPRHLARPRAVVQRPRQRVSHRRDQRRAPRHSDVRGRHGVRVERGAGEGRHFRAAAMSARCACAPSPRRTSRARRSRTS